MPQPITVLDLFTVWNNVASIIWGTLLPNLRSVSSTECGTLKPNRSIELCLVLSDFLEIRAEIVLGR